MIKFWYKQFLNGKETGIGCVAVKNEPALLRLLNLWNNEGEAMGRNPGPDGKIMHWRYERINKDGEEVTLKQEDAATFHNSWPADVYFAHLRGEDAMALQLF